jgi:hypothetical protein
VKGIRHIPWNTLLPLGLTQHSFHRSCYQIHLHHVPSFLTYAPASPSISLHLHAAALALAAGDRTSPYVPLRRVRIIIDEPRKVKMKGKPLGSLN